METSNKCAIVEILESAIEAYRAIVDRQDALDIEEDICITKNINFAMDQARSLGWSAQEIADHVEAFFLRTMVELNDADRADGKRKPKGITQRSAYQYKSGVKKAYAHGVAWYPKASELEAVQEAGKKAKGRPKTKTAQKAVTLGTVKVDRKARTLEVKLGKSTDLEAFTAAVTAIQSEPARVALFLAYCRAQGWTK
jgi:hypothetical protein